MIGRHEKEWREYAEKKRYRDFIAVVPVYQSGIGDVVEIYFHDGKRTDYISMESVMNRIYEEYLLDIRALRRRAKRVTGSKNIVPLLLENEIYIPFKARRTLSKHDSAYGYFKLSALKESIEYTDEKRTELHFEGGFFVSSCSSLSTLQHHIRLGELFHLHMERDRRG